MSRLSKLIEDLKRQESQVIASLREADKREDGEADRAGA